MRASHRAPRWMRAATVGALCVSSLLAAVVYAMVWSGPGPGLESPLDRMSLPRMAAADDLRWWPSPGWCLFWLSLAACVALAWRVDRGREERVEPLSLVAALLAAAGLASASRGALFTAYLVNHTVRTSLFDLAFGLCAGAVLLAAIALGRIARSRGRRSGATLALCSLLIPPGAMWWVAYFLVTPDYVQPGPDAVPMELPRVACDPYFSLYGVAVLEAYPSEGRPRIHARDPDRRDVEWRAYLHEVAGQMEPAPLDEWDPNGPLLPDEPLLVRADARLPVAVLIEIVEACRSERVWKVAFRFVNPDNHFEGDAFVYLPKGGEDPGEHALLEVRAADGGGLRFRVGEEESDDLEALLARTLEGAWSVRIGAQADLTWGEVAEAGWTLTEQERNWFPVRLDE